MDEESSGSAQAHVLKEEFYRTCMIIQGKIPLWWVSYDSKGKVTYDEVLAFLNNYNSLDESFIDLGNLENLILVAFCSNSARSIL